MDGSTIPYYVVEERKKLNRCIEEAPNDYEKEIYRAIRNMPVPYEKLNEILENSRIPRAMHRLNRQCRRSRLILMYASSPSNQMSP